MAETNGYDAISFRSDTSLCHYTVMAADCVTTTTTNPWEVHQVVVPAEPTAHPSPRPTHDAVVDTEEPTKTPTQGEVEPATLEERVEDLEAENAELKAKLDIVWDYLQCDMEAGSCMVQPEVTDAPEPQYSAFLDGMKCEYQSDDRTFKHEGSWVTVESCADVCEEDPECNFYSFWDDASMCIGCKIEPASYDKRFTSYKMGAPASYCEINDMPTSGVSCSDEGLMFQQWANHLYECIEVCASTPGCNNPQYSWFDQGHNIEEGWCRGYYQCDLVAGLENERTKSYSFDC